MTPQTENGVAVGLSDLTAMLGGIIPNDYPPPHARYLLERDGETMTATPCYGMHDPWWVIKTLTGEASPEPMRDGDMWRPAAPRPPLR